MELVKLRQSTQELYNDIDSCIMDLIKARTSATKDEDNERWALFRMEGLMVATLQQLSCILDAIPLNNEKPMETVKKDEPICIPSVWREEDMKKLPSMCSWASLGDDGKIEHGDKYYDANGNEITKEEYEALVGRPTD